MKPFTILAILCCLLLPSCRTSQDQDYREFRQAQKSIATSAGPLAFLDQGKGKGKKGKGSPIILLHGVPTSSWMYRKVIPGLAKEHRVIAVDLIGYGSSAKPQESATAYRPAEQARRVRALAKKLGLTNYTLMFHDMGGLVAWEMLRQDSQAISNLIALNTIVHPEGFHPPEFKPGLMTRAMTQALSSRLTNQAALALTFRNLGLKSEHRLSPSECAGYVMPLREGSAPALYQFYTSLNESLYQRLRQNSTFFRNFKGRTLILWGGEDQVLSAKQIPYLSKHLRVPAKDVHLYPKNGHFLAEEIPQEVVSKVNAFLAQ